MIRKIIDYLRSTFYYPDCFIIIEPDDIEVLDCELCNFCTYPEYRREKSAVQTGCEGSRCTDAYEYYTDDIYGSNENAMSYFNCELYKL